MNGIYGTELTLPSIVVVRVLTPGSLIVRVSHLAFTLGLRVHQLTIGSTLGSKSRVLGLVIVVVAPFFLRPVLDLIPVARLVVHDQGVPNKVETVGRCLVGGRDHVGDEVVFEGGEGVHGIPGVGGTGDAESEREVIRFDQLR